MKQARPRARWESLRRCCRGRVLITPGFLTDIAGIFFVPGVRNGISVRLVRLIEKHDKVIYDRLRLSALERARPESGR